MKFQCLKEELQKMSFTSDVLLPTDETVQFYASFQNRVTCEQVFKYCISSKAERMHYWVAEDKDCN